jgi:hypothetical protein
MPVVRMQPRNSEMVLVREGRDQAGRDEKQIWAMEQNEPKPPRITGVDKLYAEQVAAEYAQYPKVMYKVALKYKKGPDGKPDQNADPVPSGDRINPNYPMPYALAVENGFHGQIVGQGSDKGINVVYPYKTCFVPIDWNQNYPTTIDEAQCKKEEAKLLKDGWVDDPNKLILPKREMDSDWVEIS